MRVLGWMLLASVCCCAREALAEAVCAEVRIEIQQTVSLERQAFNARLGIDNAVNLPITDLDVDISFRDAQGQVVIGTSDPGNTAAVFFIRDDGASGVTGGSDGSGSVPASSTAELNWLVIPSSGAGGLAPQGQLYAVGATVSYTQGGETRSVNVVPDTIVVKPQPRLRLDYFLTTDVYSDDPFTPVVEPAVPFTLGLRIRNVGAGASANTRIETAQPRIVENVQGLAVSFNILEAYVGNSVAQPTLTMDFGNVAAGASVVGRWNMVTSLSGRFLDFAVEMTHGDELGGALTSLIESAEAHALVKDVRNDASGRDLVRDFLTLEGDTYRSYESDGVDTVVIDRSKTTTLSNPAVATYVLDMGASSVLPAYAKVPDPLSGHMRVESALRLGVGPMPPENVWISQRQRSGGAGYDYFLNVYDGRGAGRYQITTVREDLGALAGEVYRDLDDDGVRDPGEAGISSVTVALVGAASPLQTTTNPKGQFRFEGLRAGSYTLAVGTMPGLRDGNHDIGTLGGTAAGNAISGIDVAVNEQGAGYLFAKVSTSPLPQADLQTGFDAAPPDLATNTPFQLTLRLRNNGPDTGSGSLQLTLPAGLVVLQAAPTQGEWTAASNLWQPGTVAVQGEAALVLTVRADTEGTRVLRANLSAAQGDPVTGNETAVLSFSVSNVAGDLIFRNGYEAKTRDGTGGMPAGQP